MPIGLPQAARLPYRPPDIRSSYRRTNHTLAAAAMQVDALVSVLIGH